MGTFWETLWYQGHPTPALVVAILYIGFSIFYPKVEYIIAEGSRGERWLRICVNSGLILFTGYLTRVDAKQVQNGSVTIGGLTIPGGIVWFGLFAITLVLAKFVTTLLSMNLYQGLLPDSVQQVATARRAQKLEWEFQINRTLSIVGVDCFREADRELVRATRLVLVNDLEFLRSTLDSYMATTVKELTDLGLDVESATLTINDVVAETEVFRLLPRRIQGLARDAVRRWNSDDRRQENINVSELDIQRPETRIASVVNVNGEQCVIVLWVNQGVVISAFENLYRAFQTLLSESEIWDYGRVLEEYVEKYGSIEAVSEYLDSLYSEDSIAEQV